MAKRTSTIGVGGSRSIDVLLTEDVTALGNQGDIVRVKPGYARNFLLPARAGHRRDRAQQEDGQPP